MPDAPRSLLRQVFTGAILRRSLAVALLVGTLLNLINQGDSIFGGQAINWFKLCLTYCVPFLVASYGAYSALLSREP